MPGSNSLLNPLDPIGLQLRTNLQGFQLKLNQICQFNQIICLSKSMMWIKQDA